MAEEIVGNSVIAQYLYGLMRISQNRSGTVSYYGYDGHGSVRQLLSSAGAVTPTGYAQVSEELVGGSVAAQYTYGLLRISQKRATLSYYDYDGGGSVRQLLNTTGAATDAYAYDAFGNTVVHAGSTVNEFQYRGEQYDAALAIYYLRARYFRPQTGRFLSQDTYEGDLWDPLSLHKYVYTAADAVNHRDPSGHGIIDVAVRYPLLTSVVAVIGKDADVEAYQCSASCNTLWNFLAGAKWGEGANQIWLQTIINGRQVVFLASDPTSPLNIFGKNPAYNQGYSYFWVELQVLLGAGYVQSGPYLFPPD